MTHPKPAISVVVPLFNKAAYIARALESIRRQTWTDFEVVVVDDGSTDGGGAIAAQFADPRFRVVTQPNRGQGAARNRGIAEASGELIAFLDADDAWEPLFLEAVGGLAWSYPSAGILATGYRRRFGDGSDIEITARAARGGRTVLIGDYFRAAREGDLVTSSSTALPRAVLQHAGGFPEGEPMGEDRDLWLRVALDYPVAYDTRILAVYHSEAQGRSCDRPGMARRYPPAVRSLRALLRAGGLSRTQTARVQSYADWLLLKHAYSIAYDGDRAALRQLLRAEQFATARRRLEARVLEALAAVLPLRVVAALKFKPAAFLQSLRQSRAFAGIFRLADAWLGRTVVRRTAVARSRAIPRPQVADRTAT